MAMKKNQKNPSRIPGQDEKNAAEEKIDTSPVHENTGEFFGESEEALLDKKETLSEGQMNELRKKIEHMDLGDDVIQRAKTHSQRLQLLQEEEKKIKGLLVIAKDKGVVYAIQVAKNMNDPYLLDTFHDYLIKEGLYNEFLK